mgnify:CR=1 FL=1
MKEKMFNWKDFINLSEELINGFGTQYEEALYRTIISRSYYGIFKQVEDKLKELNISLPSKDSKGKKLSSHERVIFYLQNHNDERARDFGDLLDDLKRQRHKADYNAQVSINEIDAKEALELALELRNEWKNQIKLTMSTFNLLPKVL